MNILVIGAHFYNKGAHLMMKTVAEKFKEKPNIKLFLSPCAGTEEQIKKVGYAKLDFPLKHVTAYRSFNIFYRYGKLVRLLNKKYRGEIKPSKIDAVIDISGFAYSDQWGEQSVENLNKVIKMFKKHDAKFIFMPQAFGPFTGQNIKAQMFQAVKSSDMVSVRDRDSERMLCEVVKDERIIRYPDITIGLKPKDEGQNNIPSFEYICIVPNERMLDQGREFWPENKYLQYIKTALFQILEKTDCRVYIVVHDNGSGDSEVADKLIEGYTENNRVIKYFEEDPMALKGFLGRSKIVIGSRFHALVSALSQNVPCLSLGWSHKYKMLFDEYGIGDFSFDRPNDKLYEKNLDEILNEKKRNELIQKIEKNNLILKNKNDEMWQRIFDILKI